MWSLFGHLVKLLLIKRVSTLCQGCPEKVFKHDKVAFQIISYGVAGAVSRESCTDFAKRAKRCTDMHRLFLSYHTPFSLNGAHMQINQEPIEKRQIFSSKNIGRALASCLPMQILVIQSDHDIESGPNRRS